MKKSFVFYLDWEHTIQPLTDAEAGQLIKYIVNTLNGGDYKPERTVELVANTLLTTINRDAVKWEDKLASKSVAGFIGNLKRYYPEIYKKFNKKEITLTEAQDLVNAKKEEKEPEKEKPKPTKDAIDYNAFINHFNKITGKNHKIVPDNVKKQMRARLKEGYKKEDLIKAVLNCAADPYHIETNYKYLTPEFITRAAKLERFLNTQPNTTNNKSKNDSVKQW